MRTSGILLPISSLPSRYGIGSFSVEAYAFADWLAEAGQSYWQILPLGPTGYGDSPYQPFSAFAGNPYFIDLDTLIQERLLLKEEVETVDFGDDPKRVDYEKLYYQRFPVLRRAFERFDVKSEAFIQFCELQKNWLDDYSLYMAIKHRNGEKSWDHWNDVIRCRDKEALDAARSEEAEEIIFQKFLQYKFWEQWKRLKDYANRLGIKIIGDMPIYVAFDGADCWAAQEMFQFTKDHKPAAVAGCPPDSFSADGQLWGNPLYDWKYHEENDFSWWIQRMRHSFELYDVVRIDHFRGFDQYYSIPYGDTTARNGHWEQGPGMKLFDALRRNLGEVPIIAEDLGFLTESVLSLVRDSGYPGMKVIEFAFDSREESDYLPHNYTRNCVVYTGTHDNQTLAGWLDELTPEDYQLMADYVDTEGKTPEQIVKAIIRMTIACVADTAVIPMQDWLGLGGSARMNQPSTTGNNWQWRMERNALSPQLAREINKLCTVYGRNRR